MTVQALPAFNVGEISPYLIGRTDLPAYVNGLRRGLNTIVLPHGPAVRRPGTRIAGFAAATASKTATFMFGVGDCYTLEFSNLKMRFWRADGSQVGAPYELVTPWTSQQATQLRWHQSGDVMWFFHPQTPPQRLRRLSLPPADTFDLLPMELDDGPYFPENTSGITLSIASTGVGVKTVTASSGLFNAAFVGHHIRIKSGGASYLGWTWGVCTAFTSPTSIDVNFGADVASAATPTTEWRFGLYGSDTGYPSCGCIHQERMALGSACGGSFPRVDLSNTGDFALFKPGADDDNAVQLVIAADAIPVIHDVKSCRVLVIVTGSGLLRASGPNGPALVGGGGNEVSEIDDAPGSNVRAIKVRGGVIYLDAQGRSVGEARAKSQIYPDAIDFREISIRNEHLFQDSPAVDLAWANKPFNQLLAPRADGVLVMGAYNPDQDVIGFTPQEMANGAKVLSVNVLSTSVGDAPWMLVDRGSGVKTIEIMTDLLRNTDPDRVAVNLDCSITGFDAPGATLAYQSTDGAGVQTWDSSPGVFVAGDVGKALRVLERRTGLGANDPLNLPRWATKQLRIVSVVSATRITATPEIDGTPTSPVASGNWLRSFTTMLNVSSLNGTQVRANVDGADLGPFTVAGGQFALGVEAWHVTAGLAYRSEFQPMPPNPATRKGSAVDRPMGGRSRIRVVRSGGLKQVDFAGVAKGLKPIRQGTMSAGVPPPLYSGDIELETLPDSDSPIAPFLVADGALPFCIAHFAPDYVVGEVG